LFIVARKSLKVSTGQAQFSCISTLLYAVYMPESRSPATLLHNICLNLGLGIIPDLLYSYPTYIT